MHYYTEKQILKFLNKHEANCAKYPDGWRVVTSDGEFLGKTLRVAAVKAMNEFYKTRKSAFSKLTGVY